MQMGIVRDLARSLPIVTMFRSLILGPFSQSQSLVETTASFVVEHENHFRIYKPDRLLGKYVFLFLSHGLSSFRYGASGAPRNAGPRPNSPPRPAERPGAERVFLGFPAPAPPARSPECSPLKQVGRNGPRPGNERGLAPDRGGAGAGITPKITPLAR